MRHTIKQLTDTLYNKQFYPLIFLTVLAFVIWFIGPWISIADYMPLEEPEKRFYTILVLVLAWVLKINFWDSKTPAPINPFLSNHPEFTKKLETLEGRLQGAISFLKKTLINKHSKEASLHHLPWYLIVGPAGSGKTSLLASSNVNFILAKQFKNNEIPPSDSCDWWVTRDLVLVDVPGNFLTSKQKNIANSTQNNSSFGHLLWQNLLRLIKNHRGNQALNGVILALSLPELMAQPNQNKERMINDLKNRIRELKEKFGENTNFYLTITKCDLLPGFVDFFGDSGSEEISQAWGVSLPRLKENEKLIDAFANRFNALIKRLNKQLIWRLHQERSPLTRPSVKDFPLQIERLKENILSLIKALTATDSHLSLQGVYLTSSTQPAPQEEGTTHIHSSSNSTQALQIMRNPTMPSRAYFIKQLLLQGLLTHADNQPAPVVHNWKRRPKIFALVIGVSLLAAIILGNDISHTLKQTFAIRSSLTEYQQEVSQQGAHLANALPLLNALQQTAISSSHSVLLYSDKAQQSANAAYAQALQTIVLPELKSNFEDFLHTANSKNAELTYAALKAYLMLNDQQHLQTKFITDTLKQILPALHDNEHADEIFSHINAALNTAWRPIELDQDVIAHTRKILTNLPAIELGYLILKAVPENNLITTINLVPDNNKALVLANPNANQISSLFTAETFQSNYESQIDSAATETTQGNWILGNTGAASINSTTLADQLRTVYIATYIDTWEKLLANIQLNTATNLTQTDAIINDLTVTNSPLIVLLKTIKQNTHFAPITAASPRFAALNGLLSNGNEQDSDIYKTLTALHQVHTYLKSILNAHDAHSAAFQAALMRMQNSAANTDTLSQLNLTAKQSPDLIQNWLNKISHLSWQFILHDASLHIENHWQSDVLATYHAKLSDRFPFASSADQDVDINEFKKVLGPQGSLATYTKNYLLAFVDTSDKKWQWKKVDDMKIPFADAVLDQLQQFTLLQQVFFPNDDNQVLLKFTLQPYALDTNTKNFKLNLNGQTVEYNRALPPIPLAFSWPGNKSTHQTVLNVVTADNHPLNATLRGDWAWFHLVNKSTVKVMNQKELLLSFDLNGHHAKYLLFVPNKLNPFVLSNWQQFKLPEQLKGT